MSEETRGGGLAKVSQLPVRRAGGELETTSPALEGEVLTAEQYAAIQRQKAAARRAAYRETGEVVVRSVRTVVTHDHTKATMHFARRHATFILKGVEAERQRKKAERNQVDARAARARALEAGDLDRVAELNKQILDARHLRVDTLHKWVDLGWKTAKKVAIALVIALGVALVAGVLNGFGHWLGHWNATDVLHTLGAIITTTGDVVGWSVLHWWVFLLAGLGVWGFRRWKEGVRLGEQVLPEALRRTGKRTAYVEFTQNALVTALSNIGIAKLNAAIKEGWPNRDTDSAWVQVPAIDGNGYSAKLRLPQGASVAAVGKARELLAHNLGCRPEELFIEADTEDSTVLSLFRLEPGMLRAPVPPYPLLKNLAEATTDFWTGFPVGIDPRGNPVICEVFERNLAVAGRMGSGKTTLVLDLLAGAVLDPLVDIDVFVFAENFDYDPLLPCLNMLVKGDTEGNVAACMEHIQGLHADLTNRGRLLAKHGARYVTRELAAKEPGLRPRIVVIDECQAFFRQDKAEDRRAVVNMMVRFYSAARKYGIVLVFVTPLPSDQSLPRDLVAVTSNRACGAISDKHRNNVVLGEKAHENGISALGLKPKTTTALNDAGTLITIGFMDQPGALRTHFLTADELGAIAERGAELRGGQVATVDGEDRAPRDHLADIEQVLRQAGQPRVRTQEVLQRLAELDEREYRGWTFERLTEFLTPYSAAPYKTGGHMKVSAARVQEALTDRDENAAAEGDGDKFED
ncbi:ATP-binding protein [Amycolatopsis cynarae]|uniref:ATP-binding protein n=1 Tax=Amycolatopsis cynarae TaxID=2995223 RepID=A0ABY7B5J4_9PSEU|nr:ATP-binding protein [Amycolatopsis sp. HUAS 11-8]WAL67227.1 ATP-binding protein [Amycolatopsis sp. HUAS 11-8]